MEFKQKREKSVETFTENKLKRKSVSHYSKKTSDVNQLTSLVVCFGN